MEKSYTISTISNSPSLRYDCRKVLKHVSKAHDILIVVHDNRKQVVGLIYTKQLVSWTCRKHIACHKVVPCKSAFRVFFINRAKRAPSALRNLLSSHVLARQVVEGHHQVLILVSHQLLCFDIRKCSSALETKIRVEYKSRSWREIWTHL